MATLWRIELLGSLRASRGERVITHFRTQKTGALLAYLAYHGDRAHPRGALMEMLWPDHRLESARNSLSVALSSLRRQLETELLPAGAGGEESGAPGGLILADHATVRLNPAVVTTDVAEFDAALRCAATANGQERVDSLLRAVELYKGELLPGYFEGWVAPAREWLAERYYQALGELLTEMEHAGEIDRALPHARRGVGLDPLREDARRDLMRLYVAAGQPAAALRQYQELERLLKEELGAAPHAETRALAAGLALAAGDDLPRAGEPLADRMEEETSSLLAATGEPRAASESPRVVLLYRRHAEPETQDLLKLLADRLAERGCRVFVDRRLSIGVAWAREIEREIRDADAVVPLLSAATVASEMLTCEVQIAREAAEQQGGRPRLLPVRVNYTGPLPELLGVLLDPLEYALWETPGDNERLLEALMSALMGTGTSGTWHTPPARANGAGAGQTEVARIGHPPGTAPVVRPEAARAPSAPGVPVGVLPLDSPFYVERTTDAEFRAAVERRDTIVRIQGPRQMGKTSLLARGLQHARESGARVVLTDFQALDSADLTSVERLLPALAGWIADQLDLDVLPSQSWKPHLGASVNFERYLRREVLDRIEAPLVWGLDEVDRLFPYDSGSQVFGLFRSWHNRRGLDPAGPWDRLSLAMAYATEAHLFITDLNQSPFNVGTRLALSDFDVAQVADLNQRHGSPLQSDAEVERYHRLVNGQPYLANRGLWEMATRGLDLAAFEGQADRDEGVFGDHLRRLLVLLARDAELGEAVRAILRDESSLPRETFFSLRSAGLIVGEPGGTARMRCPIYAAYLGRHLL
jgi:DNA-binding SARP family transcriptional activator